MATPSPITTTYNPRVPVYAQPKNLQETKTTLDPLSPDESFVDPAKATVAGQLTGILASNSPVLQAAQAQSNQQYNARGLLQSQGGVRAGTAAMIDKAIPIAQQDAGLFGDMAKSSQKVEQDAALNNQIAGIEHRKSLNSANIAGALEAQSQAGRNEIQKLSDNAQMQRLEVDAQWKDTLQAYQLDADASKSLASVQGSLSTELNGSIERIMRDTNIKDKTSAIKTLMTTYRSSLSTAAAILNIPLKWS